MMMTFTPEEMEKIRKVRNARNREWYNRHKEATKERRARKDLERYDEWLAEGRIK